jgi:iron complex outermembrane recepter protein
MKSHPYVALSLTAISCAMLPFTVPAFANNNIEEIIISASAHQKSAQEVAGSFNVIAGDELQRDAAATLGDTLQNQVGIASSSFGPGVGIPMIRGLGGKRIEILQNSSSVGDASDISPDHAIATEALLAERIEILRGPATLRFGPGAIGGVVNVIDNRIHLSAFEGIEGALESRYSSGNDGVATVARFDAGNGPLNLHLDGVSRDSNDVKIPGLADLDDSDSSNRFIANSDARADSLSAGASWVQGNSVMGFSVSHLDNNYGLPPASHGAHSEDSDVGHDDIVVRIDMQQTSYQGKLLLSNLGDFFDRLNVDVSYTDYQHKEQEFDLDTGDRAISSTIEAQSRELHAELTHLERAGWFGTMGLQVSSRDFGSSGEESFIPASTTSRQGLYWLEETAIADNNLEVGIRFDRQKIEMADQSLSLDHDSVNIGASWIAPLSEHHRLSLTLAHSERAPAAEELLTLGTHVATNSYEIGNTRLSGESSNIIELTWVYEGDEESLLTFRGSVYHNQFSNFIFQQDTGLSLSHDLEDMGFEGLQACSSALADFSNSLDEYTDAITCYLFEQRDATFSGIELESSYQLSDSQSIELQADLVRGQFTAGSNRDIPRLPPAKIRASYVVESDHWRAALNITRAAAQNNAGENQMSTLGYTRLDASLSYNQPNWSIFIQGQNLTDRDIRNATSFLREIAPEAGRNLTIGLRYQF